MYFVLYFNVLEVHVHIVQIRVEVQHVLVYICRAIDIEVDFLDNVLHFQISEVTAILFT